MAECVPQAARAVVQSLIMQELGRLHEGVLARYGLRPAALAGDGALADGVATAMGFGG